MISIPKIVSLYYGQLSFRGYLNEKVEDQNQFLYEDPNYQNWYQFYHFYFTIRGKLPVKHDFPVWLRTGSNPSDSDIKRFLKVKLENNTLLEYSSYWE